MQDKAVTGIHWSFWFIGIIALLWNVGGAINYVVQMNADSLAGYRNVEQAIIAGRPAWATAGFAIAVFGGALGSVLLLLKKRGAYYVFIASLVGVIVTSLHTINVITSTAVSAMEIIVIVVMPLLVAGLLVWYAWHVQHRGWVN